MTRTRPPMWAVSSRTRSRLDPAELVGKYEPGRMAEAASEPTACWRCFPNQPETAESAARPGG